MIASRDSWLSKLSKTPIVKRHRDIIRLVFEEIVIDGVATHVSRNRLVMINVVHIRRFDVA